MNTTTRYLELLRARLGNPSDYRLAVMMEWQETSVNRYRRGLRSFDDTAAVQCANRLELPPFVILAAIALEKATSQPVIDLWTVLQRPEFHVRPVDDSRKTDDPTASRSVSLIAGRSAGAADSLRSSVGFPYPAIRL